MPHNRPRIPPDIERQVLIEAGHRCAVCGAELPLERAHIIAWIRSKNHSAENLLCLCVNCHGRADAENWGEATLCQYKQRPWVIRARIEEASSRSVACGPMIFAREIGDRRGEANACWNLGLAFEKLGETSRAAEVMQVCVNYEREIGHPDAEKDAAYVERLRARAGAGPGEPDAPTG